MKIKNLTRPFYSCFIDNKLITVFKGRADWKIAQSTKYNSKVVSASSLDFKKPFRITSNSRTLAIQDYENKILFFDKDLGLINKFENFFQTRPLIKFIRQLNSFVLIDTFKKKTYYLDLKQSSFKKAHSLEFLQSNFLEFQDFDFFDGKYFFLNQSKAKVIIVDINKKKTSEFLKYGREGFGYVRNPSSIIIVDGQIFINDLHNYLIQKFSPDLRFIKQIGSKGNGNLMFDLSYFSSFDEKNNCFICSDFNNDRVVSFDLDLDNFKLIVDGKYTSEFLRRPSGIDFDTEGKCYVSNRSSGKISIFDEKLNFRETLNIDKSLNRPACIGILTNSNPNILAVLERSKPTQSCLSIYKILINQQKLLFIQKFKNINIIDAQDIIVSKNDILYIADTLNRKIIRLDIVNKSSSEVDLVKISKNPRILAKTISINEKDEIFTSDFDKFKIYKFDKMLNLICEYDLNYLKNDHKVLRAIGFNKEKIFLCTRGKKQVIFFETENELKSKAKLNYIEDNWNHPVKIISYKDNVYFADKENDRIVGYNTITKKIFYTN